MTKMLAGFAAHFEEVLCAILFSIMAIVAFFNVISRYLLKYSLAFTEEILISFFVWLTLLGTAIAFREGSHLSFTFITDRLPEKIQKFLLWLSALLGVFLFLFLVYFSIFQIKEEIVLNITSSGIGIPQWWYTIGMPVWSILVIIRILQGASRANQEIGKEPIGGKTRDRQEPIGGNPRDRQEPIGPIK
jgi:TRAP-type C4-dicarboxylate transport system permease small subunit